MVRYDGFLNTFHSLNFSRNGAPYNNKLELEKMKDRVVVRRSL
ncbi:MAG: hypothetical protein WBA93_25975 [Microcoleaceae cyanobacterium]